MPIYKNKNEQTTRFFRNKATERFRDKKLHTESEIERSVGSDVEDDEKTENKEGIKLNAVAKCSA